MADFSKWSRANLEAVANDMLAALLRAEDWIRRDEHAHGRPFGTGNEVRDAIAKATAHNATKAERSDV